SWAAFARRAENLTDLSDARDSRAEEGLERIDLAADEQFQRADGISERRQPLHAQHELRGIDAPAFLDDVKEDAGVPGVFRSAAIGECLQRLDGTGDDGNAGG